MLHVAAAVAVAAAPATRLRCLTLEVVCWLDFCFPISDFFHLQVARARGSPQSQSQSRWSTAPKRLWPSPFTHVAVAVCRTYL